MTLLDDLQDLDLSAVVSAKADIRLTISAEDLQALVGDGAVASVLGEVGTVLQAAVDGFDDPATLIAPITAALTGVLDEISGDIGIVDYVDAVAAAARIVGDLVAMVSGDPNRISFGGLDIGTALERVGGQFGDHASVVSGGLARFRTLVQTVEQGLPANPAALLGPALEILLPFPTAAIDPVREWAVRLLGQFDQIAVDPGLTSGLVAALGQVRVAAAANDAAALRAALDLLTQVRANTINQLAAALRRVAGVVASLGIDAGAAALGELRGVLGQADDTVFSYLDGWHAVIAEVRETVESLDAAVALERFGGILDDVEHTAETVLLAGVDGSVEVVKQWLHDLLREVPIRSLRQDLSETIATAAQAIADADLDAPVDAVRALLAEVARVLSEADPAALIQSAVTRLEAVIRGALDELAGSLSQITTAVNGIAGQAQSVLGRAVSGLQELRTSLDQITTAIENLRLEDVAAEIADTLHDLREQVSELLSSAPIPEALRTGVEQLVSTLESIDLDEAIGAPLRELAAQLQIPDDVASTVRDGLEAIADAVASLVPANLVEELNALMAEALDEINHLDLTELTAGISEHLEQAAAVFEDVRVAELLAPAGEVFGQIVAAVDRVHPRILLRPAIDLYGQILGAVPVPDPAAITTRAGSVTSQAAEAVARAAVEPARQAVSASATTAPSGPASVTSGPPRDEPPTDLRPGDIVRLIGFLPARLREALHALGAAGTGEVLAAIDRQLLSAAASLRAVRDRMATLDAYVAGALDAALVPITAAQVDAQLALQGSAAFTAGGVRLDASLSLVASVGPTALEHELDGERRLIIERAGAAQRTLTGAPAHDLEQVAELLDALLPTGILADADAFLAALDPEPIAAELDALFVAIVDATPAFITAAADGLPALEVRLRRLLDIYNPGRLMQRYLGVLDVLREELALLDPARLADELGQVHAEIKAALLAYDPIVLAGELDTLLGQVATAVRGLDPSELLPDLSGIATQVARVADILPIRALEGVGTELSAVGTELRALDLQGMIDAVNGLPDEVAAGISLLVDAVRDEIVALLESIRYSGSHASASVSVSAGATR